MKCLLTVVLISMHFCAFAYSTQRPSQVDADESSPFLDIASSLLENFSQSQSGGGGSGLASIIGSMMQSTDSGKAQPSGAAQIIAGIGSLLANNGRGNSNGFDPSMISTVIQMFAANSGGQKRSNEEPGGLETVISLASTFLNNYQDQSNDEVETNEINHEKRNPYKKDEAKHPGDALLNLMPIVMQTLGSLTSSGMEKTEQKHKSHNHILPPFLEKIHQAWDHFTQSELSDALYKKLGLDKVFKDFKVGRDGKLDYDQLFESLQNQSFRRRWIQKAITYLADWANYYLSNPEVYQR